MTDLPSPDPTFGARTLSLLTWFAFAFFVVFLLAQHALIFPYHDDWGMAVLDYVGEQSGFVGQHFKLHHVLRFLQGMYENWSGRVVAFFLQIYLFKFGLWYVRAFQVLCIAAISLMAVRTATPGPVSRPIAALPIVLYMALPQVVLVGGLYWFSASSANLWGIPLLTLAAYLINSSRRVTWPAAMLLAISSTFHEQMGIAVVAFSASYLVLSHFLAPGAQPVAAKLRRLAATPVLACITIFAPGNFNRRSVSEYASNSLLEIVLVNGKAICNVMVKDGGLYFSILVLSLVCLWISGIPVADRSRKELLLKGLGALALVTAYVVGRPDFVVLIFVSLFTLELYEASRTSETASVVLSLFIASLASLVPLLLAPGVATRSFIAFYFLSFAPICFSFSRLTRGFPSHAVALALCPIVLVGYGGTREVFRGYRSNQEVNLVNHYRLVAASFDIRGGAPPVREIVLNKLPSPRFAETMPYQRPLIEKWMKKYYELPQDVNLVWR